jgi:YrbI family 3-deoxy-D-manno-octulosonate 8-phosphate phosphatase
MDNSLDAGAVAIILARGGSTGIPRKNLALVGGVPLVVRTIRAARAAEAVGCVVVSTDDDAIAAAAVAEGVTVIRRPADLATATSSSESAIHHALTALAEGAPLPDVTLLVQCTSPFVEPSDLDLVVRTIEMDGADSCFTVSPTHAFLWREGTLGEAVAVNHDGAARLPRQQLPPQYVETGAVYGFRTTGFLHARNRFFGKTSLAIVDSRRTLEIDEPFDLRLAEHWLAALGPRSTRGLPTPVRAIVFDFDGVMTDNRAFVSSTGDEGVFVDRGDGHGIRRLREDTDIALLVLSTEENPVVRRRCDKLRVECISGIVDKAPVLAKWLATRGIDPQDCIYVGNDINDAECMTLAGYAVAPANAVPEIKATADLVLQRSGGSGAVRELVDLLFAENHLVRAGRETLWAR